MEQRNRVTECTTAVQTGGADRGCRQPQGSHSEGLTVTATPVGLLWYIEIPGAVTQLQPAGMIRGGETAAGGWTPWRGGDPGPTFA